MTMGRAVTVTNTDSMAREVGYLPSPLTVTAWRVADGPAALPVTVKVFAISQSLGVKVCEAGATVALPGAPLVAAMVTSAVGLLFSTTV